MLRVSAAGLTAPFVRALSLSSAFLLVVVLARFGGPVLVGQYVFLQGAVVIASTVARLGTEGMLLRHVAKHGSLPWDWLQLIRRSGIASVVVALPVALAAVSIAGLDPTRSTVVLVAVSIPLLSLNVILSSLLRSLGRFHLGGWLDVGIPSLLMLVILLAYSTSADVTLVVVLWAYVTGLVAATCMSLLLLRSLLFAALREVSMASSTHDSALTPWGSHIAVTLSALVSFAVNWVPVALLMALGHVATAGLLAGCLRLSTLVQLPSITQANHLQTQFSAAEGTSLERQAIQARNQAAALSFLLACTLAVFSENWLRLLGEEFSAAPGWNLALSILAMAAAFGVWLGPCALILAAMHRDKSQALYGTCALAAATVAAVPLVFLGDPMQSAFAWVVVSLTTFASWHRLARKSGVIIPLLSLGAVQQRS